MPYKQNPRLFLTSAIFCFQGNHKMKAIRTKCTKIALKIHIMIMTDDKIYVDRISALSETLQTALIKDSHQNQ